MAKYLEIKKWDFIKNEEERNFLKMISEYETKAYTQWRNLYSDFYDGAWMKKVLKQYRGTIEDTFVFVGGYEEAQRQVIGIKGNIYEEDYPISCLEIQVKTGGIGRLNHRDYLGAILGLGIQRCKVGDIIVQDEGAIVFVCKPLDAYIKWHLGEIGKYNKVSIEEIPFEAVEYIKPETKEIRTTVASLRADSLFAAGFGISRTTTQKLLQVDRGLRCGMSVSANTILEEGDVCTLKGYGKIKIAQICGITKKGRISIVIEKYI